MRLDLRRAVERDALRRAGFLRLTAALRFEVLRAAVFRFAALRFVVFLAEEAFLRLALRLAVFFAAVFFFVA
ncbi:MAG: hypothetical protein KDD44_10250, partial [Bdellovibrionales bacterium]|nr:hypothetical protein [Bdellovibrionales bacterium]